jgi:hypothetical protein
MTVRLWHGRVAVTKARAYREFLTRRAIPDYRSVEGNISLDPRARRGRGRSLHYDDVVEQSGSHKRLCRRRCGTGEILS